MYRLISSLCAASVWLRPVLRRGRWRLRPPAYSELNEGRLHADEQRILRLLKLNTVQVADLVLFCTAWARPRRVGRQCELRAASSSPGGVSAGTRKRSLAQAPRSAMRQRSLQNGRQRLLSA